MTYVLYIFLYALFSFSLYRVAKHLEVVRAWLAFVPFAQMWLPVCIAEKPRRKWFILLFIPIVNIVAVWVVWGAVAVKLGRSVWLGRMMLVPLLNILVLPMFAFNIYPKNIYVLLKSKVRKKDQDESSENTVRT
jgi:hypothetical protein